MEAPWLASTCLAAGPVEDLAKAVAMRVVRLLGYEAVI